MFLFFFAPEHFPPSLPRTGIPKFKAPGAQIRRVNSAAAEGKLAQFLDGGKTSPNRSEDSKGNATLDISARVANQRSNPTTSMRVYVGGYM